MHAMLNTPQSFRSPGLGRSVALRAIVSTDKRRRQDIRALAWLRFAAWDS